MQNWYSSKTVIDALDIEPFELVVAMREGLVAYNNDGRRFFTPYEFKHDDGVGWLYNDDECIIWDIHNEFSLNSKWNKSSKTYHFFLERHGFEYKEIFMLISTRVEDKFQIIFKEDDLIVHFKDDYAKIKDYIKPIDNLAVQVYEPILQKQCLPIDEKRELRLLKIEKEKWPSRLNAAVLSGLCAGLRSDGNPVTHQDLKDFLVDQGVNWQNITDDAREEIWRLIPRKYKSLGGAPKKLK